MENRIAEKRQSIADTREPFEITRLCTIDGARNAATILYRASGGWIYEPKGIR
jgi:hypothetical protein